MATVPESYNAIKITVSPNALSETSTKVQGLVTDIVNQLETINTQLNKLQLSWVGQSASLANSFNQQWQTATTSLFGTQQDPDEGVLNRLAGGVNIQPMYVR
jgi:uncharacterized protein YukE